MKTIVILNLKGGVGKTTTATNLAYELSNVGETLLIDADKQGNSTEFYGIRDFKYGLGDVLTAKNSDEALYLKAICPARKPNGDIYPHLFVLPSDYRLMKSNISLLLDTSSGRDKRLRRYLAENESAFDFVVVDCAPDIDMASINALMAADLALVPITLDKNARKGLSEVWEQITAAQQENPKLKAHVTACTHCNPEQTADAETQTPAPPADTAPESSEITPAPIVQEESPAADCAEPTVSDNMIDAARDLSNYCEQNGSGECCQGCYFYDDVRGACRIGMPFTWEV